MEALIGFLLFLFIIMGLCEAMRVYRGDSPRWMRVITAFGLIVLPPIFELLVNRAIRSGTICVTIGHNLVFVASAGAVALEISLVAWGVRALGLFQERVRTAYSQLIEFFLGLEGDEATFEAMVQYLMEVRKENRRRVAPLVHKCIPLLQEARILKKGGQDVHPSPRS